MADSMAFCRKACCCMKLALVDALFMCDWALGRP